MVETSNFGKPMGRACITGAATEEPPEPPAARTPWIRPSSARDVMIRAAPRPITVIVSPRSRRSRTASTSTLAALMTSWEVMSAIEDSEGAPPASTVMTSTPTSPSRSFSQAYSSPLVSKVPSRATVAMKRSFASASLHGTRCPAGRHAGRWRKWLVKGVGCDHYALPPSGGHRVPSALPPNVGQSIVSVVGVPGKGLGPRAMTHPRSLSPPGSVVDLSDSRHSADADGAPCGGWIDDPSTLRDLHVAAGHQPPRRAPGRLHQILPRLCPRRPRPLRLFLPRGLACDGSGGLGGTDGAPGRPGSQQAQD